VRKIPEARAKVRDWAVYAMAVSRSPSPRALEMRAVDPVPTPVPMAMTMKKTGKERESAARASVDRMPAK